MREGVCEEDGLDETCAMCKFNLAVLLHDGEFLELTVRVFQVHEKDKKFKCTLCNNRFARKDTLRR